MSKGDDSIEGHKKKMKGRVKKVCCCGFWWLLLGIVFIIIAIALLVNFTKYWSDTTAWQRGLAYTGLVMLLLGLLMAAIGITFFVVLRCVYRRLTGDQTYKPVFKPPRYAYGHAPYPQQPPSSAVYSDGSGGTTGPSSGSTTVPAMSGGNKPGRPEDINVEVAEHTKF